MSEARTIDFEDIYKTLKPMFGGKMVRVIVNNSEVLISADEKQKKTLKARGLFNNSANIAAIEGEKGAWEAAAVEKYSKENNS